MSDIKQLKSYLVGLGFSVDAKQYRDFNSALTEAARSVKTQTTSIAGDLIKWQLGIVGFFTTISGAILGTISKVAQADQDYRLFGERMFISTQNARSLKIALDALGQPLEAIAFDPELHDRFMQLQKDQKRLGLGLGGDFETQMHNIRDMEFELTRLKVEFQFFTMGVASNISKMLFGDGDVLKHLRDINEWIISNIPEWSRKFATYLVPVLKDTWTILKDLAKLVGGFANEFTNLVATISGDDSLQSATFNFDKFAKAVGATVHEVANLLDLLLRLEKNFPILETLGSASVGGAVGTGIGLVFGGPGGAAVGGGIGSVLGGLAGAGVGFLARHGVGPAGAGGDSSNLIDQARQAAKSAGEKLGVDPSIIFAQWAHETNDFKDYKAKDFFNFGGVRPPGANTGWRHFDSASDFGDYYAGLIQRKYKGSLGAKSSDQFVSGLRVGENGYYDPTSTLSAYQRAVRGHIGDYAGGSGSHTTQITIGDIIVTNPGASVDDIANNVGNKIAEQQQKQNQRTLTQLQSVFQ